MRAGGFGESGSRLCLGTLLWARRPRSKRLVGCGGLGYEGGVSPKVFISLLLNVGLGALYIYIIRPGAETPAVVVGKSAAVVQAKQAVEGTLVTVTNVIQTDFKWAQLESEDYRQYIARLRKVGCPEAIIRDIILADLDNLYEPKLNKLRGINPVAVTEPYWLVSRPAPAFKPTPEAEKEIKALMEERAALIKELLGVTEKALRAEIDWYDDAAQSRYSFLSPEQTEKLMGLEKGMEQIKNPSLAPGSVVAKMEAENHQNYLREKMTEFMSSQEIYEYELRTSKLMERLQSQFRPIELTEAEFRAAYDHGRTIEEARRGLLPTQVLSPEIAEIQRKANEGIREVLGPERQAEIERTLTNPGYQQLIAGAPFLGYDKAAALHAINLRTEARKAAQAIVNNPALSPEAKAGALQDINQATEKAVGQTLGERGLKYFKRKGGLTLPTIRPAPAQP